jgi:rubrerythrin
VQVSQSRNIRAVADAIRLYEEAAKELEGRMPVSAEMLDEHHRTYQAGVAAAANPRP